MNSLNTLFQYLDAENISIEKEEFDFQFNSHPDYPSLLALSDALKFFNVNNGAFKIEKAEIDLLPNSFIARLKNDKTNYLSFVEKKEKTFVYTNGTEKKHSALKHDFELLWDDVVLLAENDANVSKSKQKNKVRFLLPLLTIVLFIAVLSLNLPNKWFLAFYIFPIIGIFFSVAALKDLFNTKSELLDKFCNATSDTSCKTVVNSTKWKIFEIVSFSDLGILFFTIQISALFLMGISDHYEAYFFIQMVLLLLSVPVILTSIYYQKYIEKKWCPICLTIMGVILLELVYVLYLTAFLDLSFSFYGIMLFLFVAAMMTAIWFPLKKMLTKVNHLKDVELKANRFKRNYAMFKKMLVASEYYELPKSLLVFGNPNTNLNISILTSPFCGHCTEPHYMLKSILDKYGEQINVSMLYNVNSKNTRLMDFVKNVTQLTLQKGETRFYEAMDYWYQTKDYEKWLGKYQSQTDLNEIETVLESQSPWFSEQDLNFTPCLFVNGYRYPQGYDLKDLQFFIGELVEDESLSINNNEIKIAEAEKL